MTNDKLQPQDEAGDDDILDSTEADQSQDIDDAETTAAETAGDEVDAQDDADIDDDPAGEELGLETDEGPDFVVVDDEAEELTNADDTVDDTPDQGDPEDMVIDDEDQLAQAESVAAKAKSSRPAKRKVTTAPVKKDKVTPKQADQVKSKSEVAKRVGPVGFIKQSAGELKKVNWPSGELVREYFIVVLIFVLVVVGFVSLLDLGFGRLLLWALA